LVTIDAWGANREGMPAAATSVEKVPRPWRRTADGMGRERWAENGQNGGCLRILQNDEFEARNLNYLYAFPSN
jgi:hypothetical protein